MQSLAKDMGLKHTRTWLSVTIQESTYVVRNVYMSISLSNSFKAGRH